MRIFLITAVAVPAATALLWQFTGDQHSFDVVATGGEIAAGTGREVGPSSAGAAKPVPRIAEPQLADRDIPGSAPDMFAPTQAILESQSPPGEVDPASLSAVGSDFPSPEPDPEFSPASIEGVIQTMIEDGAPQEVIASFERSFILAAMSPEERREAEALEPKYEPPTPEQVEGLIWNAYLDGDIPAETVETVIEEHWKQVEEDELRAFERGEVPSSN